MPDDNYSHRWVNNGLRGLERREAMTRKQIEEICPVIDLYGKPSKECWVLGYEAALKTIEAENIARFLESFNEK